MDSTPEECSACIGQRGTSPPNEESDRTRRSHMPREPSLARTNQVMCISTFSVCTQDATTAWTTRKVGVPCYTISAPHSRMASAKNFLVNLNRDVKEKRLIWSSHGTSLPRSGRSNITKFHVCALGASNLQARKPRILLNLSRSPVRCDPTIASLFELGRSIISYVGSLRFRSPAGANNPLCWWAGLTPRTVHGLINHAVEPAEEFVPLQVTNMPHEVLPPVVLVVLSAFPMRWRLSCPPAFRKQSSSLLLRDLIRA